jgi:hypothetical protein
MLRLIRWGILLLVLVLIVGFVGCARGREHRRGDDVGEGSLGAARRPVAVAS